MTVPSARTAIGRFMHDERAVTAVEFGMLAVPFFAIVFAILETAMVFLGSEVLDAAVNDANRVILTGQARGAGYDLARFRTAVCDHTFGMFDCEAIHIRVSVENTYEPAGIGAPLDRDCEAPCDFTQDEDFTAGNGSDIMLVQAYYKWPIHVNLGGIGLSDLADSTRLLAAVRVFRNEPF